jgi:hypothetical protein
MLTSQPDPTSQSFKCGLESPQGHPYWDHSSNQGDNQRVHHKDRAIVMSSGEISVQIVEIIIKIRETILYEYVRRTSGGPSGTSGTWMLSRNHNKGRQEHQLYHQQHTVKILVQSETPRKPSGKIMSTVKTLGDRNTTEIIRNQKLQKEHYIDY